MFSFIIYIYTDTDIHVFVCTYALLPIFKYACKPYTRICSYAECSQVSLLVCMHVWIAVCVCVTCCLSRCVHVHLSVYLITFITYGYTRLCVLVVVQFVLHSGLLLWLAWLFVHSRLGYVRAFVSCCIYVRRYASCCLSVPPFIVGSVHYLLLPHAALSLGVEAGISPVSICINMLIMYENRVAAEVCVCTYIFLHI